MIDQIFEALNAIDITPSIEANRAFKQELDQVCNAIDTGDRRAQELRAAVKSAKTAGPDGDAAAAALLAGELPSTGTIDAMRDELETLLAGLKILRLRRNDLGTERRFKSDPIDREVTEAVNPLIDLLMTEMEASIRELAQIFADLEAISRIAPRSRAGNASRSLNDLLYKASDHVRGLCEFPVTPELQRLSQAASIVHLGRHVPSEVHPPSYRVDLSEATLAGLMRANNA